MYSYLSLCFILLTFQMVQASWFDSIRDFFNTITGNVIKPSCIWICGNPIDGCPPEGYESCSIQNCDNTRIPLCEPVCCVKPKITTTPSQSTTTIILPTTTTQPSATTTTTLSQNPSCEDLCFSYDNYKCEYLPCSSGRVDVGSDDCGFLKRCCCWNDIITTTSTIVLSSTTLPSLTTTIPTTTIQPKCGNFILEDGEECETSDDCPNCDEYCITCKCEELEVGDCRYYDYCENGLIPHTNQPCTLNECRNVQMELCFDEKYACHNVFTC